MTIRSFTVHTTQIAIRTSASDAETAAKIVLDFENAPRSALKAVYQDDPVPEVPAAYGAPMGRPGAALDPDGLWDAGPVDIDEAGYDKGGAYWGLRPEGLSLFAVQDGMGNIAFVDARNTQEALTVARV